MSWVNWKAAAGGVTGREMKREAIKAYGPPSRAKDGYAALVYNQKDWPALSKWSTTNALLTPNMRTLRRSNCADEWLGILRDWAKRHTKDELNTLFFDRDSFSSSADT